MDTFVLKMSQKMKNCEYCYRDILGEHGDHEKKAWCKGCVPGTKYINYPESKDYFPNGAVFRYKEETVPSTPPWTTWNGTLLCKSDSVIGKMLANMDVNHSKGYVISKGNKIDVPDHIRGLWTASLAPAEYCLK